MFSWIVTVGMVSSALWAQDESSTARPKIVDAPIERVYVPAGFDNNDIAEFVIEGTFDNTCYQLGPATVAIRPDQNAIYFHVSAFRYPARIGADGKLESCLPISNSFKKVIEINHMLPQGVYEIRSSKDHAHRWGWLNIRAAKGPNMDELPYVPVKDIYIHNDETGFRRMMTMAGFFSNTCMKFHPVNEAGDSGVPVIRTSPNVLEVLPLVELAQTDRQGRACEEKLRPFRMTFPLPDELPSGKYLFHVRTMNGSSINKIDYVRNDNPPDSRRLIR